MGSTDLKLTHSKDWDLWFAIVKAKATAYKIWELVNPDIDVKPTGLTMPAEPEYDAAMTMVELKFKMFRYKIQEAKYDKQFENLNKLQDFIYTTVSVSNLRYIQRAEPHAWDLLRALKQRMAPSDAARTLALERDYNRLKKGPSKGQNIDAWFDEWHLNYETCKQYRIAEVVDARRAYRDFILAINAFAPNIAIIYKARSNEEITEAHLFNTESKIRQHLRLREVEKSIANHSAFTADENAGW